MLSHCMNEWMLPHALYWERRCYICSTAHNNSNIYTTTVATFISSNVMHNDLSKTVHKLTATYSGSSTAVVTTIFILQQQLHLLAATSHTVTNTYAIFTHNDSNISQQQNCTQWQQHSHHNSEDNYEQQHYTQWPTHLYATFARNDKQPIAAAPPHIAAVTFSYS